MCIRDRCSGAHIEVGNRTNSAKRKTFQVEEEEEEEEEKEEEYTECIRCVQREEDIPKP